MRVAARLFTAVSRRRVQEATTLNNLGALDRETQRLKESADAYAEALQTYRDPGNANPQAYLPFVANTLNNLCILYRHTQRLEESLRLRRGPADPPRPGEGQSASLSAGCGRDAEQPGNSVRGRGRDCRICRSLQRSGKHSPATRRRQPRQIRPGATFRLYFSMSNDKRVSQTTRLSAQRSTASD